MRILYVVTREMDPTRPESYAGLPYFMRRALEGVGIDVETCLVGAYGVPTAALRLGYWRIFRRMRYLRACESRVLKRYALQIERRLRKAGADAVLCASSWPISRLRVQVPTAFWTDRCFAGVVESYESLSNVAGCSVAEAHAAEFSALGNCTRAIYSSEWAADSARERYFANASKVRVVPFGANVVERPHKGEVEAFVSVRDDKHCKLLLIGTDWKRKGVQIAIDAAKSMNERGFPASLTIMGCRPPSGFIAPPYVEIVPYLRKSKSEGWLRFKEICRRSHFLIMPSRADCYPLSIAEANCFGLPCLAAEAGGIPSLVKDGYNGRLFDPRAGGIAYADFALGLMRDLGAYRTLAMRSAEYSERHYSWEVSAASVGAILVEAGAIASST